MNPVNKFEIDYNKVYDSKYGRYKIINEIKDHNYDGRRVTIRFEDTGYEYQLPLKAAKKGNVKDPTYIPVKNFVHPIHGPYVILNKYIDPNRPKIGSLCTVKFLNTGTVRECLYYNALNMEVKDPYNKIIYGVACMGEPKIKHTERMYSTWHNIIVRCYDQNNRQYPAYGGSGVSVCERWLCFEYFLDDVFYLPNGEHAFENGWNLDKDYLQYDSKNKIYGPDTCMWLPAYVNFAISGHACHPNEVIIGVRKYCNEGFYARIALDNTTLTVGRYATQKAAANAYNRKMLELMDDGRGITRMLNQVPFMSAYELLQLKHGEPAPNPNMCIIVDKDR